MKNIIIITLLSIVAILFQTIGLFWAQKFHPGFLVIAYFITCVLGIKICLILSGRHPRMKFKNAFRKGLVLSFIFAIVAIVYTFLYYLERAPKDINRGEKIMLCQEKGCSGQIIYTGEKALGNKVLKCKKCKQEYINPPEGSLFLDGDGLKSI